MLKKAKEKLEDAIHKYVDGVILPATYRVYVNETTGIGDGIVDSVHLSFEDWCARVLVEMKGGKE